MPEVGVLLFLRLLFCEGTFEVFKGNAIILLYGPDFFGVFGPITVDEEKCKWEKGLSYLSLSSSCCWEASGKEKARRRRVFTQSPTD
jgi:hypothetical protein